MKNKKKSNNLKKAFTLAEILITLGIIGVVAALTIPALMNKTNDSELKASLKKNYSVLSQAITRLKQDNGGTLKGLYIANWSDGLIIRLLPYLQYLKGCNTNSVGGAESPKTSLECWHTEAEIKRLNGQTSVYGTDLYAGDNEGGVVLNDGSFWAGSLVDINCSTNYGIASDACGYIVVDVNGQKSPNQEGKDIFAFEITENHGVVPVGMAGDWVPPYYNAGHPSECTTVGHGCAAKILLQ